MPRTPRSPGGGLTFDLRGLVWGIESEVGVITGVCARIDEHVRALNALRQEMAARLVALDDVIAVATDEHLRRYLESATQVGYPQLAEQFPDRLYTD